jgi:ABC-type nitrate/sulfonate/bicarbonate transport system substrate-binding protein
MMRSRLLTLAASATLALAACGGSAAAPSAPAPASAPASAAAKPASAAASAPASAAAKPSAAATAKVRYGLPTTPPAITTVGVYFGIENGFFKDEGLDVEVTPYNGAVTAIRALLSRDADIVETGGDTTFLARASGAPVKIIDSMVNKGTDTVVVDKSIGSFKDLAGKSYAIANPNDTTHVAAKTLAQKAGIDPAKIDFVAIGGPADRAKALLANKVAGTSLTILINQPILDAIDKNQVKVLTTLAKEFPELPLAYDITRDDLAKDQSAMLTKFVKAQIKGYRWAQANPEGAATIAEKYIKDVDHALMTRGMKGMSDLGVYGLDGGFTMDGLNVTQKAMQERGAIKDLTKPEDVATTQFIDAANKDLGPVK